MSHFQADGSEPPLPQMAAPLLPEIDSPRVTSMRLADGPSQAVIRFRRRDQMDVVGHQAVAPDLDRCLAAPLGHQFNVCRVVAIVEECLPATVASLSNVVRQTRNNPPRQSCNARTLQTVTHFANTSIVSPEYSGILYALAISEAPEFTSAGASPSAYHRPPSLSQKPPSSPRGSFTFRLPPPALAISEAPEFTSAGASPSACVRRSSRPAACRHVREVVNYAA